MSQKGFRKFKKHFHDSENKQNHKNNQKSNKEYLQELIEDYPNELLKLKHKIDR